MAFIPGTPKEVTKLSRFGLLGLWELITPGSDLWLGWGLKQTCSSPQVLSNGVSHSTYTHRDWVDSWLFVVRSQIASLTLVPSFDQNLCYKCPNGWCEAIFNSIKNTSRQVVLTSTIEFWSCKSPEGLQVPTFGSVSLIFTLASKWGCDIWHQFWLVWVHLHPKFFLKLNWLYSPCVIKMSTRFLMNVVFPQFHLMFLHVWIIFSCLG
jgi:hypothetical protein